MNTQVEQPNGRSDIAGAIAKRMMQVIVQFLILIAILLASSGRLDWVWVWVYLGVGAGIMLVNSLVLPPELIAERGQPRENVKRWDRVLTSLSALPALGVFAVAGLDERFGWSADLALAVHLAGLALMVLGQGLFSWAMASNKFFSTAVRIQTDREHTVATGGPYRYVRHPGYVGYIASTLATPLLFGSLWALVPAVLSTCILIARTALEDQTLQEELDGYEEYARRVRYRLVPGVW